MEEMKNYVNEQIEKLKKAPLAMQYRHFKLMEEYNKESGILSKLTIKGHSIVIKIDDNNAILEEYNPSFKNAPFTIKLNGIKSNTYYLSIEHALLGWIGLKSEGANSRFAGYAYSMIREGLENESM